MTHQRGTAATLSSTADSALDDCHKVAGHLRVAAV
jgi:hypothetical protein